MRSKMIYRICSLFILFIFFTAACAPKTLPYKSFEIDDYEAIPPYETDLSKIPKSEMWNVFWLDKKFKRLATDINGDPVPAKDAYYVCLPPKEYDKVYAVVKKAKTYKEIIEQQDEVVNSYINTLNLQSQYLILEQKKLKQYADLWIDAENAYQKERYEHQRDLNLSKIQSWAVVIVSFVAISYAYHQLAIEED